MERAPYLGVEKDRSYALYELEQYGVRGGSVISQGPGEFTYELNRVVVFDGFTHVRSKVKWHVKDGIATEITIDDGRGHSTKMPVRLEAALIEEDTGHERKNNLVLPNPGSLRRYFS